MRISSVDPDGGVSWRKKIWMDSLVMIKERPVFGHGINTYMTLFQEYRRKTWRPVYDNPTYAHNCYIQIATETGLVGLTFFLWIIGRFFRRIIQSMKNQYLNEEADLNILLMGLSAGVFAFLVQSFFDTNFYSLQLSTLFWFMMGVSVALFNVLNPQDVYGKQIVSNSREESS